MRKERALKPHKRNENKYLPAVASLLIAVVLLAADMYVFVNRPSNIPAILGITVLLLVWICLFAASVIKNIEEDRAQRREEFEAVLKAEKASFLLMKKVIDRVEDAANGIEFPTEEIIAAQKAIAKITISRSKENADALMNSNDKVMEKVVDFEDKLSSNNDELAGMEKMLIDDAVKEVFLKQQDLSDVMEKMEQSLKGEMQVLLNAVEELERKQQEVPCFPEAFRKELTEALKESNLYAGGSSAKPEPDFEPEPELAGMPFGEERMPEGVISDEERMPEGVISEKERMPEGVMISEEERMPEIGISDETQPERELLEEVPEVEALPESEIDFGAEDGGLSEPEIDFGPEVGISESEEESMSEIAKPEGTQPEKESLAEMPEVEALSESEIDFGSEAGISESEIGFGSEDGLEETPLEEISEEESLAEPEPDFAPESDIEETPVIMESVEENTLLSGKAPQKKSLKRENKEEDKPAMPDLSDPHKLMTPDEIAALIANM